jgi:hypothetical protein
LWHFSTLRSGRYIANIGFIAFRPLRHRCSQGRTIAFGAFSGLVLRLLCLRRLPSWHVEIAGFQLHRNIKFIAFRQAHCATRYKQESGALNYAYIRASNKWFKSLAALAGTG